MTWRDIKNTARLKVHDTMQVSALYCVPDPAYIDDTIPPDVCPYTEQSVNVRVHYSFKALGDLKGTSFHYAEKQEVMPQIIFMVEELSAPMGGAIVSISEDEMYRIDNVLPRDGLTVSCEVTVVPKKQRAGVPYPVA